MLFFLIPPVRAQLPAGKFLADSLRVGSPVLYALSYRHSGIEDVFFPDSTHDFTPFQLVERRYFPTRSTRTGSLDSVVYTLISFEIDSVQRLRLPVYRYNGRDSVAVWSVADSAILSQLVHGRAVGQPLRNDVRLRHLNPQFNYPYALLGLLGVLLSGSLIYVFFRKGIQRQWRLYQLRRRHADFLRAFQRLNRGIQARSGQTNVEKAMVLWKKYLERLERRPVSSFTTREMVGAFPDPRLADALREVDATVYGGSFSPGIQTSLQVLRELAVRRYQQRRREVVLASRQVADA